MGWVWMWCKRMGIQVSEQGNGNSGEKGARLTEIARNIRQRRGNNRRVQGLKSEWHHEAKDDFVPVLSLS